MAVGFKHRKFIQSSLLVCTLLIQIIILIFFYNEYFNENKLSEIKEQIEETKKLKRLSNESKRELLNAQNHLQEYLNDPNKDFLDSYFQSLWKVTDKIDSIKIHDDVSPIGMAVDAKIRQSELENLKMLIDSIYEYSPKLKINKIDIKVKEFQIKNITPEVEKTELHIEDSIPKKKFFSRLKDAFTGNTETKTDTVYITTRYNNYIDIDTNKIKNDIDSTISAVSEYYLDEVKRHQKHLLYVQSKSNNVYNIYNNLINLSNSLIDIYDETSNNLSEKLEAEYDERFSKNNKIRQYTVFGLMLLLIFVVIIMAYYTKLSFLYEKRLKEANEMIDGNLKFKNRILGMLSHEIRSPLKIMNIFISRIYKKTDDKNIINSLKSMRFTNDSLLMQANQILDYTKNQDKKIELLPVKFNLREETEAILNIFKPYIESADNTLKITNEIPENSLVYADKSKIHQVFINLLGNANKFTTNGEISVVLKVSEINGKILKFHATISDTGIGISESDIQKIFEPYYKGAFLEGIENVGAGLGLNLCKEIIELFQGNISIKSNLNKGTDVNFKINLTIVNE